MSSVNRLVTCARRGRAARRAALIAGLLTLMCAGSAHASGTTKIYVSPSGSDTAAGTKNDPFATLQRAQRAVRSLTATMSGNIVVNVSGTLRMTSPLTLSDAAGDSGENGYQVIYRGIGSSPAVLSGGQVVTGWTLDRATGVWSTDVGSLDTRQLYVNGVRARRDQLGSGLPGTVTVTATGYTTTSTAPQSWAHPEDIELLYRGATNWTEPRCGIDSISGTATSTTITMDQPCFDWMKQLYPPTVDWDGSVHDPVANPSAVENSDSFLSDPGTFYLDRSASGHHILSYLPRSGEDMTTAEVVAPVLETLVSGSGTTGNPLHDVVFKDLTFADATWLAPNAGSGFVNFYAGMYYNGGSSGTNADYLNVPGSVRFQESQRITFKRDRFERLGAGALELSKNSSDDSVIGNVVTDASGPGVQVGALAPESTSVNSGNRVSNNWIHGIGVEYPAAIGILFQGTQDTTAAHNQLNDLPYTGIGMLQAGSTSTSQRAIENNIFDAMQVLADGGGVYVAGPEGSSYATGAVVRGNVVHGLHGFISQGLYPDYGPTWETFKQNVVYDNWEDFGVCAFPEADHVRFLGNFWDDDQPLDYCGPQAGVTFTDNTLYTPATFESDCANDTTCAAIVDQAGLKPQYQYLLRP